MRRMKRSVTAVLLLVCMLLGAFSVHAADDRLGEVVDGSVLTDDLEAEGIAFPTLRGVYLSGGSGGIVIDGGRRVTITGHTDAYRNADTIKVTLYLQKLSGGSWNTIASKSNSAKNTNYVKTSNSYSVTGGYYYRVHGVHTTIKSGVPETATSNTKGIWID